MFDIFFKDQNVLIQMKFHPYYSLKESDFTLFRLMIDIITIKFISVTFKKI